LRRFILLYDPDSGNSGNRGEGHSIDEVVRKGRYLVEFNGGTGCEEGFRAVAVLRTLSAEDDFFGEMIHS